MKKLVFIWIFLWLIFLPSILFWASNCEFLPGDDISWRIATCLGDTDLVQPVDGEIESGIKQLFVDWTTNIATALSLIAIGAIVLGWLMMTLAGGEDEKIKKGKDIVKWSLIWFLAAISAWAVVRLVVELVFAVAS